jgi:exonuclease III
MGRRIPSIIHFDNACLLVNKEAELILKTHLMRQREQIDRIDSGRSERRLRPRALATYAAIGTLAVFGGTNIYNRIEEAGTGKIIHAAEPVTVHPTQELSMCSLNMHDETASKLNMLAKMIKQEDCDPVALQEVNKHDMDLLGTYFPEFNITTVVADAIKQQPNKGGYGNVLMTRQEPRDIKRLSIKGTPLDKGVLAAAGKLLPNITAANAWASASEALQEDRGAEAMTISVEENGKKEDLRVITSHIAGFHINGQPDINLWKQHKEQFARLLTFIKDNTEKDRPTVFCGDLNAVNEEVVPAFANISFVVPTEGVDETLVDTGEVIDHCAVYDAGVLGLGQVSVLKRFKTDHYALKLTTDGNQAVIEPAP